MTALRPPRPPTPIPTFSELDSLAPVFASPLSHYLCFVIEVMSPVFAFAILAEFNADKECQHMHRKINNTTNNKNNTVLYLAHIIHLYLTDFVWLYLSERLLETLCNCKYLRCQPNHPPSSHSTRHLDSDKALNNWHFSVRLNQSRVHGWQWPSIRELITQSSWSQINNCIEHMRT